jgi:hypothetical protein
MSGRDGRQTAGQKRALRFFPRKDIDQWLATAPTFFI